MPFPNITQRLEDLENVLFPSCDRCHDKMKPLSKTNRRHSGGTKVIVAWECPHCLKLYESETVLKIIYRIEDYDKPHTQYAESQTEKAKRDESERIARAIDTFIPQDEDLSEVVRNEQ